MSTILSRAFFAAIICLGGIAFSGCKVSYSFTGASIPPEVKTVSVQYFQNYAPLAKPTYSQDFTEALRDIFNTQTNLKQTNKNGDLQFSGTVVSYVSTPVAIQSNDAAAYNRLTITVSVRFVNTKDEKANFEQNFSRFADYSAALNLAAVEDQLIKEINQQLVQDIFNRSVTNW